MSKPGGGNVTEPGVEPTSSGCMTGDCTTHLKRPSFEWYWNPSPDISEYMCGSYCSQPNVLSCQVVEKIRAYTNNPAFDPEIIKKASKAAFGLCCWVRAMEVYDRVAKLVAPKRTQVHLYIYNIMIYIYMYIYIYIYVYI